MIGCGDAGHTVGAKDCPKPTLGICGQKGFLPMFPELTGCLNSEISELFMGSMEMLIPSRDHGWWWESGPVALIVLMAWPGVLVLQLWGPHLWLRVVTPILWGLMKKLRW